MNRTDVSDARDQEALRATGAGSAPAFEDLYDRYAKRVYNYVRTLVRDDALAEDLMVETMTSVWQSAATFTQRSRVSTWIIGIARHKALDALRRSGRRPRIDPLDELEEPVDPGADPVVDAELGSDARVVLAAIEKLSTEHQEVLRLAFYEELPYEEIATLLAIPDNTVKTRVYYAKQQLRRHLGRLGVEALK